MSTPSFPVHPQVEQLGHPQDGERLGPDLQRALAALLHEHRLPILEAGGHQVPGIVETYQGRVLDVGQCPCLSKNAPPRTATNSVSADDTSGGERMRQCNRQPLETEAALTSVPALEA